ncbi:hypothetical protein LSTR_LSTR004372 [Laodelphax striatellus]|uniref:Uncharacterized protein n=1 Tax=Laodelphax striatellus TaxID=195883 RepID=A0A482X8Z9_LAOST|nr:hypothetical protein LSTR_LSTR004372 [Laodelphax striatellus]
MTQLGRVRTRLLARRQAGDRAATNEHLLCCPCDSIPHTGHSERPSDTNPLSAAALLRSCHPALLADEPATSRVCFPACTHPAAYQYHLWKNLITVRYHN